MISIPTIIIAINVTFTITLIHIALSVLLGRNEKEIKLIFEKKNKFLDLEDCRSFILSEFEQHSIGPFKAFGLMLCMISKSLSITSFVVTITLYLCFMLQ